MNVKRTWIQIGIGFPNSLMIISTSGKNNVNKRAAENRRDCSITFRDFRRLRLSQEWEAYCAIRLSRLRVLEYTKYIDPAMYSGANNIIKKIGQK